MAESHARVTRYFFGSDNPGNATSELIGWVRERGASTFSVNLLYVEDGPSRFLDAFVAELGAFALPDDIREHLERGSDEPLRRQCRLWQLTEKTCAVLRRYLPDGLVAPPTYGDLGWLENPRFYRHDELMLGAITHEGGGFVRLRAEELQSLESLSIRFRDSWEWIG